MDFMKTELVALATKNAQLYARSIVIKVIIFILFFTFLFWLIRDLNLLPEKQLEADFRSIPMLFGAGNMIFSLISGFIIQIQWTKWDRLMEANRGEITMLRQLYILAHHFPREEMNDIRFRIFHYLITYINASSHANFKILETRSVAVDTALVKIEDSMFSALKKHPDIGPMAFSYLTSAMEYREKKIQTSGQRLPRGIKMFVLFGMFSVIFGSLFVPFNSIGYNYYFSLVIALLAYGMYLIIEDFEHPYRPGNFVLSVNLYKTLAREIKAKLILRGFDFKAQQMSNVIE